jgi:hypothetical protein
LTYSRLLSFPCLFIFTELRLILFSLCIGFLPLQVEDFSFSSSWIFALTNLKLFSSSVHGFSP